MDGISPRKVLDIVKQKIAEPLVSPTAFSQDSTMVVSGNEMKRQISTFQI
jgi:hypothetical protein